jgi:hypothetical protein
VAFALVGATVGAALLLPRKHEEPLLLDDDKSEATPVIVR